jgi:uncharacterized Zn finger protein (UPF0148 family)
MSIDKFAVDEGTDDEQLAKLASQGCPKCGKPPVRQGRVLLCPVHGSEPFEQATKSTK